MLPDPVAVWLVRPGRPEAVPGTLSLERDALTFTPEDGEPVRVHAHTIVRARRRLGTPILVVRYRDGLEYGTLFLYFMEPPPLRVEPSSADQRGRPRTRRGRRRDAMVRLGGAASLHTPVIRKWTRAIGRIGRG